MKGLKEGLTLSGALAAAVTASACCIGPLLLTALGIGGAAFAVALEPYRPWFVGVTLLLLGAAFYLVHRRSREAACAEGGACAVAPSRGRRKVILWVVTVLVLAALAFPYYVNHLF